MNATLGTSELEAIAVNLRRDLLEISYKSRSGHIGSSMSAADLLAALYFQFLNVDPLRPDWEDRDRFIMSKGHACAVYYAALCRRGFFTRDVLLRYALDGGTLGHHPHRKLAWGMEASTGSLGHGLSMGAGLALAARASKAAWRTAVMLSDGEMNEGTVWEAVVFAAQHKLDNLVSIIDCNKIQALGFTRDIADLSNLDEILKSFGWSVRRINGHCMRSVSEALNAVPFEPGKPSAIVADTVKGKGVSFMENQLLWHYRCPDAQEFEAAMKELGAHA